MLKTYSLYILDPQKNDLQSVSKRYRFFRVSPEYILVYTEKKKPVGAVKVEKSERLSPTEIAWLMQCNMQIQEEIFRDNADMAKAMADFLKDLEKELKSEQEALGKAE